MRKINTRVVSHDKHILLIALATAFILMIPFMAMQFSDEVNWGMLDFVFVGALLLGAGLGYELIARRVSNSRSKLIVAAVTASLIAIIWIELAVGIFD